MLASLRVISPPEAQAVDIELALRHARVDSDSDSDLYMLYLESATDLVQKYLCRSLISQTLEWTISEMARNTGMPRYLWDWAPFSPSSGPIELPYSPVQSIASVTTSEWNSPSATLLGGTGYNLDLGMDPARLQLGTQWSWGSYNHLSVRYVAGYGDTSGTIPRAITNAIMMTALNLYENRGDDELGGMTRAIRSILDPYKIHTYAR
jgi:uncharacterized phiE125 gp8 family phage protein